MASYTMELRAFVDKPLGMTTREHIELVRQEVFDFPYPFFNETIRPQFETDFIRHFYMREIGFESEHLFKLKLESWLNINMPYYNELFKSEGLIKNPLINVDWTETRITERDITSKTKGTSSQTSENENKAQGSSDSFERKLSTDTPDSRLQITTNNDGTGVIEYASSIDEDKNKAQSQTTATDKGKASLVSDDSGESKEQAKDEFHVKGTQGMKTESEMLELYRRTLLRIQSDIFFELNKLFMLVY